MKNSHKIASICTMLLISPGDCLADTKIGIGTGVSSVFSRGYGGVISMPIKLDSYMLIEPYLGYTQRSEDTDTSSPEFYLNDRKSYQIGVGLFYYNKDGPELFGELGNIPA